MKRLLMMLSVGMLLAASWPALAQGGRRFPPQGRPMPAKQVEGEREMPERPHFGRMSPEERRQLRRDIGQHGREIYHEKRREERR